MSKLIQLLAGLAVVAGLQGPAHSQSNKPVRAGTWYEDQAGGGANAVDLSLTFAQSPTDKYLTITRVTCILSMSSTQTLGQLFLRLGTTSGSTDIGRIQAVDVSNYQGFVAGGSRFFSLNQSMDFKVGPGRFPSLRISTGNSGTSSNTTGTCTTVGTLTDE